MLIIEDSTIYLTRGDSARLQFRLRTSEGEDYEMGADDLLTLTLRALPDSASPVLLMVSGAPGADIIPLRPEDTQALDVGEYSADVQLNTAAGDVYTVWPILEGRARTRVRNYKNFVLMPEVTMP